MTTPEIEIDIDSKWEGIIVLKCRQCQREHRLPLRTLGPESKVNCPCGAVYEFPGDEFRNMQRSFDELKRTIQNFGR